MMFLSYDAMSNFYCKAKVNSRLSDFVPGLRGEIYDVVDLISQRVPTPVNYTVPRCLITTLGA